MQRAIVTFILLIVVIVALLVAFGVFESPEEAPPNGGEEPNETGATENGTESGLRPTTPTEMPDAELLDLDSPSKVLFISRRPMTANKYMTNQWPSIPGLSFQSWYLYDERSTESVVHDMDPLTSAPTASLLADEDFDLLVIDNFDPAKFPDTFWSRVKERVESGRMGLLALVQLPLRDDGTKTEPLLEHQFLTHPIVKTLMPVKSAKQVRGDPTTGLIAGSFRKRRPFKVSEAGQRHIATRLTEWPTWSPRIWEAWGEGKGALTTIFGYPVEEVADGARVLLSIDGGGEPDVPVVIVGDESKGARVMWVGTPEWSWEAHFDATKSKRMATVVRNITVWAAGARK